MACFALIIGFLYLANAQERLSTSAGVFTAEQANKGRVAYNANCAVCHGDDLRGTDREVPNLDEEAFKSRLGGKNDCGEIRDRTGYDAAGTET